jgi:1,4-dihydroxy-2-naphthoate octaprenyltransferase
MKSEPNRSKLVTLFLAGRPKFLVASVAPVIVGSALGYAAAGFFLPGLFVLAVLAVAFLNLGVNLTNDYFDHISGNDWANRNPTPFSGGRRFIQEGILSPKTTLLLALVNLTVASIIGVAIVVVTQSVFILALGLAGLAGGFFYTAPPVKLGYRSAGEPAIALLVGVLPVCGAYYLQTTAMHAIVLVPACLLGLLVFLVILANEFPDVAADAAADKRTLVVRAGVPVSIWIYRIALVAGYVVAAVSILRWPIMFFGGLFYLCTTPVGIAALACANQKELTTAGRYRANQITVALYAVASLALAVGFVVYGLLKKPL